jgi:hypothetical protein
MSVITKTFKINGVLTDMTSVILSNNAATYGVKRQDNDAVVVADGTAMTKTATGTYQYEFTDPADDLTYDYVLEVTYSGETYWISGELEGPAASAGVDAYATSVEGDAYFGEQLNITTWTGASTINKGKALQMGTNIIDRLNFRGEKTVSTQDNQFPRKDDTAVPQDIKDACCEIAIALLDGKDPEMEYDNLRMLSQTYANIKSTYIPIPPEHIVAGVPSIKAWRYLKPYLRDAGCIDLYRVS